MAFSQILALLSAASMPSHPADSYDAALTAAVHHFAPRAIWNSSANPREASHARRCPGTIPAWSQAGFHRPIFIAPLGRPFRSHGPRGLPDPARSKRQRRRWRRLDAAPSRRPERPSRDGEATGCALARMFVPGLRPFPNQRVRSPVPRRRILPHQPIARRSIRRFQRGPRSSGRSWKNTPMS